MQASIFLSHSSADKASDDLGVGSLRDRLYEELTARGFKVLFDMELLGGGMEWRPVLHRWLGECDGAVILFSPAALDSDWVLKESTILTWRKSLGSRLRILPVLVGCQREEVVEHRAFKPLDLGSYQFLRLDQPGSEQAVAALVRELVGALAGLQPEAADAPMRKWIRDVGSILGKVDPVSFLEDAAIQLGIDADARGRFEDLHMTVAHQLLHVGLRRIHGAFRVLRMGLDKEWSERLVGLVVPTWVSLEAGAHVGSVLGRRPGRRRLAINSERRLTGEHYLMRATCGKAEPGYMVTVSGAVGAEDELELLSRYESALWRAVGGTPPVKREVLQGVLDSPEAEIYILLQADAARPILVPHGSEPSLLEQRLLATYQNATFVFLTRDPALWAATGRVPYLEQITPELLAEDEVAAEAAQMLIEMLFTAGKEANLSA